MITDIKQFRLLIVDDNEFIHEDLRKILLPAQSDPQMIKDESLLFGPEASRGVVFEIDSALQGKDGLECVLNAQAAGRPYALAFVDVRMPPGWDGVETILHLWEADPDLQIVICTAYSDYNWNDISERLGISDNFVVLKKPFDIIEVSQLAHAMTAKWTSMHRARLKTEELDRLVEQRTSELSEANAQVNLLAAASEAAANSISITDLNGVIVWTNPAFSALSGYSAEEVRGKNLRILDSGRQDANFFTKLWTTITSGNAWRGELVNRRKDGTFTAEEMTITPVASKLGMITHFVAINQDITGRKKAESSLREAEEKYRAIFEDAIVGIFQANSEGQLFNINPAFAAMLGYNSPDRLLADLSGNTPPQFINRAQLAEWAEVLEGHGAIRNAEVEVICREGARKWLLVNIRAARDMEGHIVLHEGTVEDITDRKLAQQQVNFLAYYDALTGLPNRTLLKDRLDKALASARRRGNSAALLFLDLDRFKNINDSLGHSFGDLLLRQVSTRLIGQVREQDTVARVGGDEFLIVLTSVESVMQVEVAVDRLIDAVTGEYVIQGRSLNINCSVGMTIFPEHGRDAETLIKNADAAMYCAKEKGSNTSCFFTDEMNKRVMERLTLENSLRVAIDKDELFLVYQPQVDIASGNVTGLEALVRWQHPELGLVMPDKFIEVAESSGLMISIGEWVLRTACSQIKKWRDEGFLTVPVAINVSAVQFRQKGFRELIKQVLFDMQLTPRDIELELTESLLLSNADITFKIIHDLRDMGLKLVIDDFGTGYSSLSYLRHFPVTKLKIDRSFICDVAFDPDAAAIATAIISMSKALNLKVIAEGVENEAQLEFLREHHCDEFQGYFFSPPLIVGDVMTKLREPLILKCQDKSTTALV